MPAATKSPRSDTAVATPDDAGLAVLLDQRIAAMRHLLALMQPQSTAHALRALRDAFPDAPLDQRVRAVAATMH